MAGGNIGRLGLNIFAHQNKNCGDGGDKSGDEGDDLSPPSPSSSPPS